MDAHTVGSPAQGATLIPLPKGVALAAGVLSVDLPLGIREGDAYDIEIRQLTDAAATQQPPPPTIQIAAQPRAQAAAVGTPIAWRQVIGGCQFAIRISTKEQLLLPGERLLAVLRWIAQEMPHNKRRYPVLLRYIEDIAGRVQGFGGNPTKITPSPTGEVARWHPLQPTSGGGHGHGLNLFTGKVDGIVYDHFGDFEGFILALESGLLHRFASCEDAVRTPPPA